MLSYTKAIFTAYPLRGETPEGGTFGAAPCERQSGPRLTASQRVSAASRSSVRSGRTASTYENSTRLKSPSAAAWFPCVSRAPSLSPVIMLLHTRTNCLDRIFQIPSKRMRYRHIRPDLDKSHLPDIEITGVVVSVLPLIAHMRSHRIQDISRSLSSEADQVFR